MIIADGRVLQPNNQFKWITNTFHKTSNHIFSNDGDKKNRKVIVMEKSIELFNMTKMKESDKIIPNREYNNQCNKELN